MQADLILENSWARSYELVSIDAESKEFCAPPPYKKTITGGIK